jgi:hypothetical protein
VFIRDEILIDAPAGRVLYRLQQYLRSDVPAAEVRDADANYDAAFLRAGISLANKQVIMRTLPPVTKGAGVEIAMSWSATGAAQSLFPSLEAIISIEPVDDTATRVGIVGSYLPPLGYVGLVIDRVIGRRIAAATLTSFLAGAERYVVGSSLPARETPDESRLAHPARLDIEDEPFC